MMRHTPISRAMRVAAAIVVGTVLTGAAEAMTVPLVDWGGDALHAIPASFPAPQRWRVAPDDPQRLPAMPFDISYIPGPLPVGVAAGGTGLTSGTSGGILCYTAAGTLASSGALTANAVMKGGGAGACPSISALVDNGTIVTATEPVDVEGNPYVIEVANAASTGTTVNKLAKLTGAPSTAVLAATSDTDGELGIVIGGAGTSGNAQVAISGTASCVFDGATTAGHWVEISSSSAGECHDSASASRPTGQQAIGVVLSTNGSGGTYAVKLELSYLNTSGGGSGTVNSGTQYEGAYYATSTTAVSTTGVWGTNAAGQFVVGNTPVLPLRVVTAAGAITVSASTDYIICVNKTSGAATAVNLPASPTAGQAYVIKDCKGDAATNNITVTPNAGNIDGASTYVIATNHGSVDIAYDGTQWEIY